MKLKLKKEIIENKSLSNNAIIAYIGLVSCLKNDFDNVFTNKNMIAYYLTKKTVIPKRFEESLRKGMSELLDKQIVICKRKTGTDYYMEATNIKLNEKDKFIFVDFEDVQKILSCSYQGKNGLLRFYICMLGTFISRNKIKNIREPEKYSNVLGMMSQEYLAELSNVSIHTVVEYIKILEQLNLIYVSRCSFMFKDVNGNVKKHNNIYGRYADMDIIDEFTRVRHEMYDDFHKVQLSTAANKARSLMQKYNYLCKGIVYDLDIMNEIYQYICEYNKKHPKKQKDMSVFNIGGYCIRDDKIII